MLSPRALALSFIQEKKDPNHCIKKFINKEKGMVLNFKHNVCLVIGYLSLNCSYDDTLNSMRKLVQILKSILQKKLELFLECNLDTVQSI